jgi:arsenate reductase (thioredoxin)
MAIKILVLCTGNSCRSQMAEGFIRSFSREFSVFSAGTHPEKEVNTFAVAVMKEKGIDISSQIPQNVNEFVNDSFDYVITVCDYAREVCPVFIGPVKHRIHVGFEDPALAKGTDEEKMAVYRKVRDEIETEFRKLFG